MCGIAGIHAPGQAPEIDDVLAMIGTLAHRGPDGSGCLRDAGVALGHTRLAIVDTAHGAQPMCNEDGSVWVVFNGEVFNHVELADELTRRGHVFRTRCDTEAIVHAWEEWGAECFSRFNGQWALAIWDRRTRRLILSRDRLGVRPLFYTREGSRLLFASEVKALFADGRVRREIDPAGVDQVFSMWSTVAPRTVFAGVSQLPPGCYAVADADGMTVQRYWSPSFPDRHAETPQDLRENAERLRDAVTAATCLRFARADVPVGAYLSGGLDSAVTASVIARLPGVRLQTFSLRFTDDEFDEGGFQAQIADRLGTEHQSITVGERDIADVFPDVVRHAETVLLRTAPAPMFLLSRLARSSGCTVVVTGEGADEVLAGYDIFREARVRDFLARSPESPERRRALSRLYPWMRRSPAAHVAFAAAFFGNGYDATDPARSHRPRWQATSALRALLARDSAGDDPTVELTQRLRSVGERWDPLSQAQWLEMTALLPGYILSSQGDRMLMANSVEGRFPFLDPEVVALAASFPARQKMLGLDEKHLLKRAFADLVPPGVLSRPKQPYRAPDAASFFAGGTPDWFDEVMGESALRAGGLFHPGRVAHLVEKCRRRAGRGLSNTDNMRIVAVASAQLLISQFVGARGRVRPAAPEPVLVHDLVGAGIAHAHI